MSFRNARINIRTYHLREGPAAAVHGLALICRIWGSIAQLHSNFRIASFAEPDVAHSALVYEQRTSAYLNSVSIPNVSLNYKLYICCLKSATPCAERSIPDVTVSDGLQKLQWTELGYSEDCWFGSI